MARLALIHASIVMPSLLVLFSVLGRIKRKDREPSHLAVSAVHSEIGHSRFLGTIRTMVAKTASALLLGRVKVKLVFAYGAVNHGRHLSSYPFNVAWGSSAVMSRIVIVNRHDVLPSIRINDQVFTTIHYPPTSTALPKIDKMIKRTQLSICLKMSVTNVNVEKASSDEDVRYPVRPNLIEFSDL
jgi:hypothetical protein